MTQKKTQKKTEAAQSLITRISATGPVSVTDFMAEACSHYYAHRVPFGTAGDFTTAPEISQMFGEMIAACLADVWMQAGKPADVKLIELGPGRGTLAADIMRTLSIWQDCAAAVSLHLVETSPALRKQQGEALARYPRVYFHDSLEDVPEGFSLIVANEFFDALPIRQFEKQADGWAERAVGYDKQEDKFFFTTMPLTTPDIIPAGFQSAKTGSIFETSPASHAVLDTLCQRMAGHGGLALVLDYGYAEAALGDTLQSLRNHRFTKVLDDVGDQDITAHVDFATFRERAAKLVAVHGAVTQHDFLARLGIMARAAALCRKATPKQRKDIEAALYRLTAPSEMGHLFKVLGFTRRGSTLTPAGFYGEQGP